MTGFDRAGKLFSQANCLALLGFTEREIGTLTDADFR
jgi:hypothetical protein